MESASFYLSVMRGNRGLAARWLSGRERGTKKEHNESKQQTNGANVFHMIVLEPSMVVASVIFS
jgi:hypothetical protein